MAGSILPYSLAGHMSTTNAPLARERLLSRSDVSETQHGSGRGSWPRRILVATDGSVLANDAFVAARMLAQRSGASVEMTTVYSPHIALPPSPRRRGFKQCEAPDRSDAARLLTAVRHQRSALLRPDERRNWHLRLHVGDPGAMILHAADEWAADLIVLSLGCREPANRLRSDRTVLCLARNSSVPVYASLGAEDLTRCIVALPNGRAHAPTLRAVVRSLSPGGRMWVAIPSRLPVTGPDGVEFDSVREIVAQACGPELERDIDSIEIERVSVDGDMLAGVLRIADDVDAHFVAAPNQGAPGAIRAFLPNLGEPLLRSARCSVLLVPDETRSRPVAAPSW